MLVSLHGSRSCSAALLLALQSLLLSRCVSMNCTQCFVYHLQAITRKTRILDVNYNASNNEQVSSNAAAAAQTACSVGQR